MQAAATLAKRLTKSRRRICVSDEKQLFQMITYAFRNGHCGKSVDLLVPELTRIDDVNIN
jgi:hypothetical protein